MDSSYTIITNNIFAVTLHKTNTMEGVTILKDETLNKRYVQIDLDLINNHDSEEILDLIDVIIAESRKGEETFTLEEVTEELKRLGKL